jgi:hypothetical protein
MPGLGATEYSWRPDVAAVVRQIESRFPRVRANTYQDHPWPSWDRVSVDFWGLGGRGDPLGIRLGEDVRSYLLSISAGVAIRHWIWRHQLWTSWGGVSYWRAFDHSGKLRHLHVTYWK